MVWYLIMIEGNRNYLELQETTYGAEFKRKLTKLNKSLRNIRIERLFKRKDEVYTISREKTKTIWTGPNLVKFEPLYTPRFNEYHEPKEIIHTSPNINVKCTVPVSYL